MFSRGKRVAIRMGMTRTVFFGALLLCACSSTPGGVPDSGSPDSGKPDGGTPGVWTQIIPKDGANSSAQTVSGFWFQSPTNGVVSFAEGLVEHFSSPTTIDKIALDGSGKLGGADDEYFGFIPGTSLGLVVRNLEATQLVTSGDDGKSFTYAKSFQTVSGAPQGISQDFPLLYAGTDKSSVWHVAISAGGGDVYSSPTAPGPSATWTLTWHPAGTVTVPATIPAGDCTDYVVDASQATQAFAASTDGSSFVYASSSAICHSTDGKSFVDVSANITPSSFTSHNPPLGFLFTSPTAGIAYYGSELDLGGTAYVLYTADGGGSWTVGTLPAAAQNIISLKYAFASPTGTLFLVGGGDTLIFFKSVDGGKTWTDLSAKITAYGNSVQQNNPVRLVAGYALDDQNVWVGSDTGFIAYSATGGQ